MFKFKVISINAILAGENYSSPTPYSGVVSDKTLVSLKLVDSDGYESPLTNAVGNFTIEIPTISALPIKLGDVLTLSK